MNLPANLRYGFLLLAISASVAAELPLEPEAAEVAGHEWEVGSAPDAVWGVKSSRTKGLPTEGAPAASPRANKVTHIVAKGETLTAIAKRYKTSVAAVQQVNGLRSTNLVVGQKLLVLIPAATAPPAEVSSGPAPKPTVTAMAQGRSETVRMQVFLDRAQFCPGRIDGLGGKFLLAALARYRAANPSLSQDADLLAAAAQEVPRPYTTYKLREADFSFIHAYPSGWPAMAAQSFLSYRTPWEFVAERFHVSEDFLRAINPQLNNRTIQPGDSFLVPNVAPFLVEASFAKRTGGLFAKKALPVAAVIRQKDLMLELVRGSQVLACFPITLGKPETRGKGDWKIVGKVPRPTYSKRPRSGDPVEARGKHFTIRPGPNNPVGVLWMSLQKPGSRGVSSQGLHGTYTPDTIGRATSLGCIRLANWDIVRAASWLEPGATLSWR